MIRLPDGIPVLDTLRSEGVACSAVSHWLQTEALMHVPGVLRILFLNLMPEKEQAEADVCRMLASEARDVLLIPVKFQGMTYKTTSQAHMDAFYVDVEKLEEQRFEGLIINGAPLEHLPFEEVRYWQQLCRLMDWAATHVRSTLHVCWGAQAALFHHYGIPKYSLSAKRFGIYAQKVLQASSPMLHGVASPFLMPVSRHTEVRVGDFSGISPQVVAVDEEGGVGIAVDEVARRVFITGHPEYEPRRLAKEYWRDVEKGSPIQQPVNYFENDDPHASVRFTWGVVAHQLYQNWLNYCEGDTPRFETQAKNR